MNFTPIREPASGETYNLAAMFKSLIQSNNQLQSCVMLLEARIKTLESRPAPTPRQPRRRKLLSSVSEQYAK